MDPSERAFSRILREALEATRTLGERVDVVSRDVLSADHNELYRSALALEDAARTAAPSLDRLTAVVRRGAYENLESLGDALDKAPDRTEEAQALRNLLTEYRRVREVMASTMSQINEILGGLNRDMERLDSGAPRDTILRKA